ncbi:hypothetical protein [Marinicella sp. W31]|uniref:hypothetical protein n=1 Tax=Marinicella sp. W31 TaxID=3023713 RepID=UPI003757DDB3
MKKIFLIICCLVSIQTHSQSSSSSPLNGPNDCLIQTPGSCPADFLLKAFCFRDESVCSFPTSFIDFRLIHIRYYQDYGDVIFPDISGAQAISILRSGDEAALHEIYEYSICLISPDSCYTDGESGLTVYHSSVNDECPPSNNNCQGGPTDSKICQVTPEACTNIGD